jgi:undecaprenyl-diphosphatase
MNIAVLFSSTIAEPLTHFDHSILTVFTSFANHHRHLDELAVILTDSNLACAGLIVLMLVWFWFRPSDEKKKLGVRKRVVSAYSVAFLAPVIARILAAFVFPFRARPIADVTLIFPPKAYSTELMSWSSFPSDHAALFFSLAMAILYISRRLGWTLFAYVLVVGCLPRIYLGLHYPTDIIGGLIVGVAVGWLVNRKCVRELFATPIIRWEERRPASFYVFFFLWSFEVAEMFSQTLGLAIAFVNMLHPHLHH